MKKNKFKLLEILKPILNLKITFNENIQSKQSAKNNIRPNHQPSWMYRND